jgi:glycogen debranching enzyme
MVGRPSYKRYHQTKREVIRRIKQSPVHALFMDCTHDNEVPAQKRDARDTLPNAALVNMCASATGSVMGYDEIYPTLVDLVHESDYTLRRSRIMRSQLEAALAASAASSC